MAVTITCPTCGEGFAVPTEVLGVDGHQVMARMDRSGLYGHMQTCAGRAGAQAAKALSPRPGKTIPQASLTMRVGQFLDSRGYIDGGRRACTMCGTPNVACMLQLDKAGVQAACCPACGGGNTHPSPGEAQGSCAEWAADRG